MTDIEIARNAKKQNIYDIAKKLYLNEKDLICYGTDKAKIIAKPKKSQGKLILVTAINPTPFGEGKTTVSIGLADALNVLGKKALACLREPSMGPVFGIKGGATGGGYSQVIPMEDINLHFTGDFHAIAAANNLLSAAIYNHIYQGNELDIQKITFNRCLDVNDRALREVKIGEYTEKFDITAASEMMTIFTLAKSVEDLKQKIENIIIGYNSKNKPVFAKELNIAGSLVVLLKDAMYPNLVQTLEGTPAIIHGGPFANIAHGCNSVIATKLSLSLADYTVTEAGFGSDLGAEKFLDIKCKNNNISPDAIVLVATIKALKYNGDNSLTKGIVNLKAHIENLKQYNIPLIVCLNKYETDTEEEEQEVKKYCEKLNVDIEISTAYSLGGKGALDLASKVLKLAQMSSNFMPLYKDTDTIKEKISVIATKIYHASNIEYTKEALEKIKHLETLNLDKKPVCIAKTQYSLSDNSKLLGYPTGHTLHVKDIKLYNGAGIITVLTGNIMTMPGLPKRPNYEKIKIENDEIEGLS